MKKIFMILVFLILLVSITNAEEYFTEDMNLGGIDVTISEVSPIEKLFSIVFAGMQIPSQVMAGSKVTVYDYMEVNSKPAKNGVLYITGPKSTVVSFSVTSTCTYCSLRVSASFTAPSYAGNYKAEIIIKDSSGSVIDRDSKSFEIISTSDSLQQVQQTTTTQTCEGGDTKCKSSTIISICSNNKWIEQDCSKLKDGKCIIENGMATCKSSIVETSCSDSDNGKDYKTKGTITQKYSDGSSKTLNDACSTENYIQEYYCENNKFQRTTQRVSDVCGSNYKCSDGKCVSSGVTPTTTETEEVTPEPSIPIGEEPSIYNIAVLNSKANPGQRVFVLFSVKNPSDKETKIKVEAGIYAKKYQQSLGLFSLLGRASIREIPVCAKTEEFVHAAEITLKANDDKTFILAPIAPSSNSKFGPGGDLEGQVNWDGYKEYLVSVGLYNKCFSGYVSTPKLEGIKIVQEKVERHTGYYLESKSCIEIDGSGYNACSLDLPGLTTGQVCCNLGWFEKGANYKVYETKESCEGAKGKVEEDFKKCIECSTDNDCEDYQNCEAGKCKLKSKCESHSDCEEDELCFSEKVEAFGATVGLTKICKSVSQTTLKESSMPSGGYELTSTKIQKSYCTNNKQCDNNLSDCDSIETLSDKQIVKEPDTGLIGDALKFLTGYTYTGTNKDTSLCVLYKEKETGTTDNKFCSFAEKLSFLGLSDDKCTDGIIVIVLGVLTFVLIISLAK